MSALDALRADLDAARAELLDALDGITQEEFVRPPPGEPTPDDERWPVRDVLWHVGRYDDFVRRWIDAARRRVPPPAMEERRRPPHMETPALMREWLAQTRRATLVLLGKLDEADLDVPRPSGDGGERTYRQAVGFLARHDREHAAQVRALRAGTSAK